MEKLQTKKLFIVLTAVGLASLAIGFVVQPGRAWAGLLVLAFYLLLLGLGGGFFTALQFVSGANWFVVLRNIPVSLMNLIAVAAVLFLGVIAGAHSLYEWTHAEVVAQDHLLSYKSGYLNLPFFIARTVFYFASLAGIWYFMRKTMKKLDETKDPQYKDKLVRLSAAFLFVLAYVLIFAGIDYVMSLEPHWYTTMFPIYIIAGLGYSSVAAIIYLVALVKENGGLKETTGEHLHDLGKYQFMFVVFWAYIAFSQFMLMWYANMPEETIYLERRLREGWATFTALLWFFHFVVPFAILLSASIKKNFKKMKGMALYLLFLGFVDTVWMVYGGLEHHIHGWPFSWMEIGIFLAVLGLLGLVSWTSYQKMNPLPYGDPDLEASKNFHQSF